MTKVNIKLIQFSLFMPVPKMSNPDHAQTVENLTGTSKQTSEALSNAQMSNAHHTEDSQRKPVYVISKSQELRKIKLENNTTW